MKYILLVVFAVLSSIPFAPVFADDCLDAGVRFRSFGDTGGNEVYLGIPDLGNGANRNEIGFNWNSPGSFPFTFTYDRVNAEINVQVNGESENYTGVDFTDDIDTLLVTVASRDANSSATLENLVVNGTPTTLTSAPGQLVTDILPITDTDFGTITGTVVLDGPFSNSQELSRIELRVGEGVLRPQDQDCDLFDPPPPPPDLRLNLTAECAVGDTLYWRVTNDTDQDIPFTWNGPGANDGNGVATANSRTYFTTQDAGGANTTIITWDNPSGNSNTRTKAHNNEQCNAHVTFEKVWSNGAAPDLDGGVLFTAESSLGTATCTSDNGNLSCTYTTGNDLLVPFGETYSVSEVDVQFWDTIAGEGTGFTHIVGFDPDALPDDLVYLVASDRYCESDPNATPPFNLEKFCEHTVVNVFNPPPPAPDPDPLPPATPVPTLNAWTIGLLIALMAGIAVWRIRA